MLSLSLVISLSAPCLAQQPAEAPKPADEPRGLKLAEAGAFAGYTLFAPLNSKSIHLVDMAGKVVHTWATEYAPGGGTYLLDNGHVLRCARLDDNPRFHGGGIGGRLEELDWDNNLVWEFRLADEETTQHHDLKLLPNGNLLVIAWEWHAPEQVRQRGRKTEFIDTEGLWTDAVYEVQRSLPEGGAIVWSWHTWDHLVQDNDPKLEGFGKLSEHPGRIDINADHRFLPKVESDAERAAREKKTADMRKLGYAGGDDGPKPPKDAPPPPAKKEHRIDADWLHMNAIDYEPEQDLILLSTPHLGEIWVIDHSTSTQEAASEHGGKRGQGGALLYRWGTPRNYGIGGVENKQLFYQHNAQWIAGAKPGELRVLLFNNGSGRPEKEFSRVEELVLPFEPAKGFARAAGQAFGPAAPIWTYSDPEHFYSGFISGAQRLANGDTLICEGVKGRVFEVRPDGHCVWDFWNDLGGEVGPSKVSPTAPPKALFRATRIAKDDPRLKGKLP